MKLALTLLLTAAAFLSATPPQHCRGPEGKATACKTCEWCAYCGKKGPHGTRPENSAKCAACDRATPKPTRAAAR